MDMEAGWSNKFEDEETTTNNNGRRLNMQAAKGKVLYVAAERGFNELGRLPNEEIKKRENYFWKSLEMMQQLF